MADQKITELTADTAPTNDDLVVTVNDPAGTPVNRKMTIASLFLPIAKPNSDGTTVILDVGTTVASLISAWASAARISSQNGAANNPSYQFGGGGGTTNKGMYSPATADIGFSTSSTYRFRIADAGVMLGSGERYLWSSTSLGSGVTADTGLTRQQGSVVEINNGTAGQSGILLLRGRTFANLPGTPVAGMLATVTDSNTATWGATIAGGGANNVLARYNGTNWTVVGA
jgi:hypothetical protein